VLEAPTQASQHALDWVDLGYARDIDAKYDWGKELGKGGNAVVREVISKETGDVFACKSIAKQLTGDFSEKKKSGHVESIKRELEVLRRLSGSLNVVRLIDVFEDEQHVYVVQELCKGGELWHRIGERHYSERTVRDTLLLASPPPLSQQSP
jgi:calcium-dependent protein kinase